MCEGETLHVLQHTNAGIGIQSGRDIEYIQTRLGHSSVQIALYIYGNL